MTRKRLSLILRLGLGLGIVAVVLLSVPWYDNWSPDEDNTVRGKILEDELPAAGVVQFELMEGEIIEVPVQEVREGLLRVVQNLRLKLFLLASLPLLVTYSVNALRWMILARALGFTLGFVRAIRLSFIGLFFNNVVPGATGGDFVRAYYVARTEKNRTESVVAVLMDRIVGLTAMAFQAGIVALYFWNDSDLRGLTVGIVGLVVAILLGTAIFYSKRIRKLLRLDRLVQILPLQRLFKEVDAAFFAYRYKKKAVLLSFLLSFVSQGFFIYSQFVVGKAINVNCSFLAYLLVIPIASIVSSIPVLPGGWGLGDAAYVYCFGLTGVARAPALAIGVLYRLLNVGWSLVGGVIHLGGAEGPRLKNDEAQSEESPA